MTKRPCGPEPDLKPASAQSTLDMDEFAKSLTSPRAARRYYERAWADALAIARRDRSRRGG